MMRVRVPTVATIVGEGGSGGALAVAVMDRVLILENAISQIVQVLGFIRLGRNPTMRNGTDRGPRRAIGKCRFCQHPLQISDCGCAMRHSQVRYPNFLARCRGAR